MAVFTVLQSVLNVFQQKMTDLNKINYGVPYPLDRFQLTLDTAKKVTLSDKLKKVDIELDIENNPIGVTVHGTDLFFQKPLSDTKRTSRYIINSDKKQKITFCIDLYNHLDDIENYNLVAYQEDNENKEVIEAFPIYLRIVSLYVEGNCIVFKYN